MSDTVHAPTHPLDLAARMFPNQTPDAGAAPRAVNSSGTQSDAGASGAVSRADGTEQASTNAASAPATEPTLGPVPENVAALRKSAPIEERVYGASGYKHVQFNFPDVQPEAAKEIRGEFHQMLADASLSPGDAETVVNVVRAGFANPPDAATREAWRAQVSEVDRAEALALAARDPRANAFVTRSYAIEHPRVVQILAERARAERARGRL